MSCCTQTALHGGLNVSGRRYCAPNVAGVRQEAQLSADKAHTLCQKHTHKTYNYNNYMNYRLIDSNNGTFNVLGQILTDAYVYGIQVQRSHLWNEYKTIRICSGPLHGFRPIFNTLIRGEPLSSGPRKLASRN